MSYQLSFGMHQGRTHEWLFFHTPWYADYIMRKGIHRQPHNFDEEEGDHFAELFRRASHLTGLCPRCGERPITYMGLTRLHGTGTLGHVDFYCDECEYMGGSPTGYYQPSFFLEYDVPRCEQLRITNLIKRHYIGADLTQARMEQFFRTDEYFVEGTAGWCGGSEPL